MRGAGKRRLNRKNPASLFGRRMSDEPLQLQAGDGDVSVLTADGCVLWRYCFRPDVPTGESPRPYAHPVCSLAGDLLTNCACNQTPGAISYKCDDGECCPHKNQLCGDGTAITINKLGKYRGEEDQDFWIERTNPETVAHGSQR